MSICFSTVVPMLACVFLRRQRKKQFKWLSCLSFQILEGQFGKKKKTKTKTCKYKTLRAYGLVEVRQCFY